jgi:hypothetical protein
MEFPHPSHGIGVASEELFVKFLGLGLELFKIGPRRQRL